MPIKPKVIIAGAISYDHIFYLQRLPWTDEIMKANKDGVFPGGKGLNQAVASAAYGMPTYLVGKTGEDAEALNLRKYLKEQAVGLKYVGKTPMAPTGKAFVQSVGDHHSVTMAANSANDHLTKEDVREVQINPGDVVVGQTEISSDILIALFEKSKARGAKTVLNFAPAKKLPTKLQALTDIIVVNERNLSIIVKGTDFALAEATPNELAGCARTLLLHPEKQDVVLIRGEHGLIAITGQRGLILKSEVDANNVDVTGMEDCVIGNLAASIADEKSMRVALTFSAAAGAIAREGQGAGTAMPKQNEVVNRLNSSAKPASRSVPPPVRPNGVPGIPRGNPPDSSTPT
ncbi:MAG: PfkB family carbohydrate kinase [Alphaproteobacteria bacterium]